MVFKIFRIVIPTFRAGKTRKYGRTQVKVLGGAGCFSACCRLYPLPSSLSYLWQSVQSQDRLCARYFRGPKKNQVPVPIGPFAGNIHLLWMKVISPYTDLFNNAVDNGGLIGDN